MVNNDKQCEDTSLVFMSAPKETLSKQTFHKIAELCSSITGFNESPTTVLNLDPKSISDSMNFVPIFNENQTLDPKSRDLHNGTTVEKTLTNFDFASKKAIA